MKLSAHFSRSEFACKCGECNFDTVDAELLKVLELLRAHYNAPITINSGARCKKHNNTVGGSRGSQHTFGKASDIVVKGISAEAVADYLEAKYFDRYGIGRYSNRTHIDVRSGEPARWREL